MDFWEDASILELAENHARKVLALEESESKRIMVAYRRVRQDLRDRLEHISQGSFTAQRMRVVLAQVDAALSAMQTEFLDGMGSAAGKMADLGIDQLAAEIMKWDKRFNPPIRAQINLEAVRAATVSDTFLFNQAELYKSGMTAYSAQVRGRIGQGLLDATITGDISVTEINSKLGKTFLGEQWKLERIVRTELHNVYSTGKLNGMAEIQESTIPDLKKTLFHPDDNRTAEDTRRLMKNNPVVDIDEPFIERSTGKVLEYMAPPNRPNDRAILIPFRESWKK